MKFLFKVASHPFVIAVLCAASLLVLSGCQMGMGDVETWSPSIDVTNTVALFHVGDDVSISFSGGPPEALPPQDQTIKEDGTITMPQIGKVKAVGKTAGQLQDQIHDLYVPAVYTQLTVTVKPGDRVYYVQGEVKGPGRQFYLGETTVTRAITSAGDFTDFADKRHVLLIRANGKRFKVNCRDVVNHPEKDPPVYPGDQILVKQTNF